MILTGIFSTSCFLFTFVFEDMIPMLKPCFASLMFLGFIYILKSGSCGLDFFPGAEYITDLQILQICDGISFLLFFIIVRNCANVNYTFPVRKPFSSSKILLPNPTITLLNSTLAHEFICFQALNLHILCRHENILQ